MTEGFYPKEENLGRDCLYWDPVEGCRYPKVQLMGRRSCEGIVDDVCLFIKDGRPAESLTDEQMGEIRARIPDLGRRPDLPPGDTRA